MLTPEVVIAELACEGYVVTPRRLTDWRQKGLLPPLTERGQGRGKGWVYGWEDPLVVEQARTIVELLDWYGRTAHVPLLLWLLGFPIPSEIARAGILRRLDRTETSLRGAARSHEDLADRLSQLAIRVVDAAKRGPKARPAAPAEAWELAMNTWLLNTVYEPDDDLFATIAEQMTALVAGSAPSPPPFPDVMPVAISSDQIQQWRELLQSSAALPDMRAAVASATEEELRRVQADCRVLADAIRAFAPYSVDDPALFRLFHQRLAGLTGPWLAALDLRLRQDGKGHLVDRVVGPVEAWTERIRTDPAFRAELDQLQRQLTSQFAD